jgi:hypothetical protein
VGGMNRSQAFLLFAFLPKEDDSFLWVFLSLHFESHHYRNAFCAFLISYTRERKKYLEKNFLIIYPEYDGKLLHLLGRKLFFSLSPRIGTQQFLKTFSH